MGPSASAGKKVRPPTMRITPTKQADEEAAMGREGAAETGTVFLAASEPAIARRDDHQEAADQHRDAERQVVEERVAGEPAEGRAVIAGARGEGIEDLGEAVRPGIEDGRHRRGITARSP